MIVNLNKKFNSFPLLDLPEGISDETAEEKLQAKYNKFVLDSEIHSRPCPICGGYTLILWGHYIRRLFLKRDCSSPFSYFFVYLSVQRVRCKQCKKTHAIHPLHMLSYCPYAIDDVLSVLTLAHLTEETLLDEGFVDLSIDYAKKLQERFQKWLDVNNLTEAVLDLPLSSFMKRLPNWSRFLETDESLSYLLQPE